MQNNLLEVTTWSEQEREKETTGRDQIQKPDQDTEKEKLRSKQTKKQCSLSFNKDNQTNTSLASQACYVGGSLHFMCVVSLRFVLCNFEKNRICINAFWPEVGDGYSAVLSHTEGRGGEGFSIRDGWIEEIRSPGRVGGFRLWLRRIVGTIRETRTGKFEIEKRV